MSFSQAVSGLNAAATNLDVIGNNIANSATYGFKSGTASFADMFAGSKVGLGVKVAGITQDFTDGTTTNTGRGLDVAISQNGFFRLVDSNGSVFYSRNGQFKLDENRNLVNMQGMQLTGYPATGTPPTIQQGANPAPITIPNTLMAAKSTTTASMQINLNSTDPVPSKTPFSVSDADSYNKKGTVTVYDSQGNAHDMNVYFVKTKDNEWAVYTHDSSDPAATAPTTASTTLKFNENGILESGGTVNITTGTINGATAATFSLSFLNSMQQNTGANNIVATNQNGYKPGDLVSYQINNDGTVVGNYSNEQEQVLGQIVLANFANNEGLASQGDNVWAATQASGVALLGTAGSGNFGKLTNGALEASNVDLSKELVNMIVAQRNYQSNAQTIKTQDQILNTLVTASTPGADMTPGQLDYTSRPLDVALQQDGWLVVQAADGAEGYTRNGNIQVGPTGQLTIQGHPVIGEGGPITVPEGSEITIAADGTISALNPGDPPNTVAPVGRLKLVKAEGNEVQRSDDGLFRLTAEAQAERGAVLAADPSIRIMSGVLEGSNVKPVEAMTDMIANARRFEMQMKVITSVDENEGRANQLLSMS
ncbi:flagellar hook protein FlgE [Salmonella enterica]